MLRLRLSFVGLSFLVASRHLDQLLSLTIFLVVQNFRNSVKIVNKNFFPMENCIHIGNYHFLLFADFKDRKRIMLKSKQVVHSLSIVCTFVCILFVMYSC
jgi:hypothetical protein